MMMIHKVRKNTDGQRTDWISVCNIADQFSSLKPALIILSVTVDSELCTLCKLPSVPTGVIYVSENENCVKLKLQLK